jgi:hypothetical protein
VQAINRAVEALIGDLRALGAVAAEGDDTVLSVPIANPETGQVEYVVGTFNIDQSVGRIVVTVDILSHPEWIACETLTEAAQAAITDYDRRFIHPTRPEPIVRIEQDFAHQPKSVVPTLLELAGLGVVSYAIAKWSRR